MFRVILSIAAIAPVFAQRPHDLFEKAPPGVEEALRMRVSKFFQLQTEGKPRLAEALVADDSKDAYYEGNKPKCISFELVKFSFSDEFRRARAVVTCEMFVNLPGFMARPVKVPLTTLWKLEKGDWYWYVEAPTGDTPFGTFRPGGGGPGAGLPSQIPSAADAASLLNQVRIDRNELSLKPGQTGEVILTNGMPGPVTVAVEPPSVPGLHVDTGNGNISAGGSTAVKFHADKSLSGKPPATVTLKIQQTSQRMTVQVSFPKE